MATLTCFEALPASPQYGKLPVVSKPGPDRPPIASLIATLRQHKGVSVDRIYANVVFAPLVMRLDGEDQELQRLLLRFGWCAREGFAGPLDLRGLQASLQKHLYVPYQIIGTGAYGQVQRAYNRETGELQAIKKVKMTERGLCEATLREISTLRELNHRNIVRLRDVIAMVPSRYCYLVLELMDGDLHSLLYDRPQPAPPLDLRIVKSIMFQVLSGLHHAHSNSVMHRDLKPHNILLGWGATTTTPQAAAVADPAGAAAAADPAAPVPPRGSASGAPRAAEGGADAKEKMKKAERASGGPSASPDAPWRLAVKIADFGLARSYLPSSGARDPRAAAYTDWVVTLAYRAPELLLGSRRYGPAVDLWSAGCVAAELLLASGPSPGSSHGSYGSGSYGSYGSSGPRPLFGWPDNEAALVNEIFNKMGPPPAAVRDELPEYEFLAPHPGRGVPLEKLVPRLASDPLGADLLAKMLSYDYRTRITASSALRHPWFDEVRPEEERAAALAAAAAADAAAAAAAEAAAAAAAAAARARLG